MVCQVHRTAAAAVPASPSAAAAATMPARHATTSVRCVRVMPSPTMHVQLCRRRAFPLFASPSLLLLQLCVLLVLLASPLLLLPTLAQELEWRAVDGTLCSTHACGAHGSCVGLFLSSGSSSPSRVRCACSSGWAGGGGGGALALVSSGSSLALEHSCSMSLVGLLVVHVVWLGIALVVLGYAVAKLRQSCLTVRGAIYKKALKAAEDRLLNQNQPVPSSGLGELVSSGGGIGGGAELSFNARRGALLLSGGLGSFRTPQQQHRERSRSQQWASGHIQPALNTTSQEPQSAGPLSGSLAGTTSMRTARARVHRKPSFVLAALQQQQQQQQRTTDGPSTPSQQRRTVFAGTPPAVHTGTGSFSMRARPSVLVLPGTGGRSEADGGAVGSGGPDTGGGGEVDFAAVLRALKDADAAADPPSKSDAALPALSQRPSNEAADKTPTAAAAGGDTGGDESNLPSSNQDPSISPRQYRHLNLRASPSFEQQQHQHQGVFSPSRSIVGTAVLALQSPSRSDSSNMAAAHAHAHSSLAASPRSILALGHDHTGTGSSTPQELPPPPPPPVPPSVAAPPNSSAATAGEVETVAAAPDDHWVVRSLPVSSPLVASESQSPPRRAQTHDDENDDDGTAHLRSLVIQSPVSAPTEQPKSLHVRDDSGHDNAADADAVTVLRVPNAGSGAGGGLFTIYSPGVHALTLEDGAALVAAARTRRRFDEADSPGGDDEERKRQPQHEEDDRSSQFLSDPPLDTGPAHSFIPTSSPPRAHAQFPPPSDLIAHGDIASASLVPASADDQVLLAPMSTVGGLASGQRRQRSSGGGGVRHSSFDQALGDAAAAAAAAVASATSEGPLPPRRGSHTGALTPGSRMRRLSGASSFTHAQMLPILGEMTGGAGNNIMQQQQHSPHTRTRRISYSGNSGVFAAAGGGAVSPLPNLRSAFGASASPAAPTATNVAGVGGIGGVHGTLAPTSSSPPSRTRTVKRPLNQPSSMIRHSSGGGGPSSEAGSAAASVAGSVAGSVTGTPAATFRRAGAAGMPTPVLHAKEAKQTHPVLGTPANVADKPAFILGLSSQRSEKQRRVRQSPAQQQRTPQLRPQAPGSINTVATAAAAALGLHLGTESFRARETSELRGAGGGGVGGGGGTGLTPQHTSRGMTMGLHAAVLQRLDESASVSFWSPKLWLECLKHIACQYALASVLGTGLQIAHAVCVVVQLVPRLSDDASADLQLEPSPLRSIGSDAFLSASYGVASVLFLLQSHLFFASHLKLAYSMAAMHAMRGLQPPTPAITAVGGTAGQTPNLAKRATPRRATRGGGAAVADMSVSQNGNGQAPALSGGASTPQAATPAPPPPLLRVSTFRTPNAQSHGALVSSGTLLFRSLTPAQEIRLFKTYMLVHALLTGGVVMLFCALPRYSGDVDVFDALVLVILLAMACALLHLGLFASIFSVSLRALLAAGTAGLNPKQLSERQSVLHRLQVLLWSSRVAVWPALVGALLMAFWSEFRARAAPYVLPCVHMLVCIVLLCRLWSLNWRVKAAPAAVAVQMAERSLHPAATGPNGVPASPKVMGIVPSAPSDALTNSGGGAEGGGPGGIFARSLGGHAQGGGGRGGGGGGSVASRPDSPTDRDRFQGLASFRFPAGNMLAQWAAQPPATLRPRAGTGTVGGTISGAAPGPAASGSASAPGGGEALDLGGGGGGRHMRNHSASVVSASSVHGGPGRDGDER